MSPRGLQGSSIQDSQKSIQDSQTEKLPQVEESVWISNLPGVVSLGGAVLDIWRSGFLRVFLGVVWIETEFGDYP